MCIKNRYTIYITLSNLNIPYLYLILKFKAKLTPPQPSEPGPSQLTTKGPAQILFPLRP